MEAEGCKPPAQLSPSRVNVELNESKHYSIPSSSISSICPNPQHSIQINDHNGTSSQSPPVPPSVQTRNQQEYQDVSAQTQWSIYREITNLQMVFLILEK